MQMSGFVLLIFQVVLLDWLSNSQRRILVMTLNPAGQLVPKSSISDLYQNYAAVQIAKPLATSAIVAAETISTEEM